MTKQVLIATIGSEPKVVTLALDLLRNKGYFISEIIIVHTVGQAVQHTLRRLEEEFSGMQAENYRFVPVRGDGGPVGDIVREKDTAALLRTLYRAVLAEKRAGRLVHLSIAGGRKPMAVYAVEDRIPRVYPWMNEPGGGIVPPWNSQKRLTAYTFFSTTSFGFANTAAES